MSDEAGQEAVLQDTMNLLVTAGDAKKQAQEALSAARNSDFTNAKAKLAQAGETLNVAHNTQTQLLTREAQGKPVQLTLLTIHAQDHLMTAITYIDLVKEIVNLYEKLGEK